MSLVVDAEQADAELSAHLPWEGSTPYGSRERGRRFTLDELDALFACLPEVGAVRLLINGRERPFARDLWLPLLEVLAGDVA